MKREIKTLRELVNESGANGIIRIDAGNGSAGPMWIGWDDAIDAAIGGTEMLRVNRNYNAYDNGGDDNHIQTFYQAARQVVPDYDGKSPLWASDWIEEDDRNAPYRATNPYRYRLIF
jgi:hypothetical protein